MLWSVIRLIFKTSSVTPDFFYVFNLVLSFSTCSQSFNKICVWEVLGANVPKVNFRPKISLAQKYRIVPASSPWVSEDAQELNLLLFYNV